MMELFFVLILAILVYLTYQMMKKPSSLSGMCASGACGGCSKCSCSSGACGKCRRCQTEGFRFRHRSDCGCNLCEGFRFRQADIGSYLKETNVQDYREPHQASVITSNDGLPFYFKAYGTELSMGPGQGDPGAVAPNAQYVDLYKAGQNLLKDFPDFKITSYEQGGAISDLFMAKEEHDKLQNELIHY